MLSRNIVAVRGAHKAAASTTASKPVEKVTKLGNGLTVATIDSQKPLTQLVLAFRAGSRYEKANQAGLTHTLRNFVGRDSKDHFGSAIVWSASQYGGVVKSFTSRDLFGVSVTVPRDSSAYALHVLAQAAANPGFKPWEIEDVYPTMRADNGYRTAYDLVVDQIHKAAYRNGGLGNSVYAPCSKIGAICTKSLTEFAEKHITTGNAVLFATNAVHEDVVIFGDNYSPLKSGSAVSPSGSPYKGGEVRRDADSKYAHVIVAGEGAAGNNAKAVATQAVLLTALGNSSPVKFNSAVNGVIGKAVGEHGSASAFQAVHSDSGLVGAYVVVEGAHANQAVSNVVGAFKSLKVADFEAVKKQAFNNALRAAAHSDNYSIERTSQLFSSQDKYIDLIPNVTASDVEAAAKKLTSKLSVASYGNIAEVPYVDTL